jgi:D-alanyl-D-alanine carboxypeptidase/D-alanyl-D-alanine-endopeptidase (penicillin-binding protein 4)
VRDINKFSNNVMARQLFLTLGQKVMRSGIPGDGGSATVNGKNGGATTAQADEVVRAWLEGKTLRMPELVLDNGSGLSRRERLSADSTSRLLQAAWKSPVMPELMASLPLLAVDGTMRKRLRDGSAAGQAHIKTGSLEGVKTMAGYLLDKSGRRQVVVFFVNHPHAAAAQPAQDALLQWVYERAP